MRPDTLRKRALRVASRIRDLERWAKRYASDPTDDGVHEYLLDAAMNFVAAAKAMTRGDG